MMMYQSLTTVSSNSVTVYKRENKQTIALSILTYFTVSLISNKVFDRED